MQEQRSANQFSSKATSDRTNVSENIQWVNQLTRSRRPGPRTPHNWYSDKLLGASTIAVHAGGYEDPTTGAVGTPIFQTTTFHMSGDTYEAFEEGSIRDIPIYSRYGNPNQWAVQEKLSALEKAESSIVFSSGMAAISSALIALTNRGGHVVTSFDLYGGTYNFMREDMQQMGREISFVSPVDLDSIQNAIQPNTQVLFFEVLSNPLLKTIPLRQLANFARENKLLLIVDNTFLSPICLQPLNYGAHLVIHSCTKYLNGHSNLVAGSASGSRKYVDRIWTQMLKLGGSLDPHACSILENNLKTLALRMKRHIENAEQIVKFLSSHPKICRIYHPSVEDYPYPWAEELLTNGAGGMVSFNVKGGDEGALKLLSLLQIPRIATSLGGLESLVSLPFNTSHSSLTTSQRMNIGIEPGLVRYSIGIEDSADLILDLDRALDSL